MRNDILLAIGAILWTALLIGATVGPLLILNGATQ